MNKQVFADFKQKIERILYGHCMACLRDVRDKRFLRLCFMEAGVTPEIFNPIGDKLFPNSNRYITFIDCGAQTSWCSSRGSHEEFLEDVEKVFAEIEDDDPRLLKFNPVLNQIAQETSKFKKGQAITIEQRVFSKGRKRCRPFWMIFSSISPDGIINGYQIDIEACVSGQEATFEAAFLEAKNHPVMIDTYGDMIYGIYPNLFVGPMA